MDAAAADTSAVWNASVIPSVAALLPPQRRLSPPVAYRGESTSEGEKACEAEAVARERDPAAALPARYRG